MTINVIHVCDDPDALRDLSDVKAAEVDLIISSGDLCRDLLLKVRRCFPAARMLGVRGNHDTVTDLTFDEDLHLRARKWRGVTFAGFQGAWRYKPVGHFLYDNEEVEAALKTLPAVDVLVTHNPPALDGHEVCDGIHNGYSALNEYCRRSGVKYLFHGHSNVHKLTKMGPTLVVGTYGRRLISLESVVA